MVKINIEKKHLLVLLLFLSIVTIALVIASNPSTKPNPGHASNEIMVNIGGADKTLQAAIDAGDFGGGKVGAPAFDSGWVNMAPSQIYPFLYSKNNTQGTFDLTGKNPEKFLVSLKFKDCNSPYGPEITNFADGSSYGYSGLFYGAWYQNMNTTGFQIQTGYYFNCAARIYIWSWE
ncbi:hypothetical protein FJZ19_06045 [Candidatus Pacearchaeota archaeon]|nr:hypothetical protein [Candidatus Pacearchaeota archaeon]